MRKFVASKSFTNRNAKGSSSGGRKMIPNGNPDLHKAINRARNGKYFGKHKRSLINHF